MLKLGYFRTALLLICSALVSACADNTAAPTAAAAPSPTKPPDGRAYLVVDQGQTLDKIAHTYRVSKRDLIAINHLPAPYTLKPGMVLEIPEAKPVAKAKPPAKAAAPADGAAAPLRTAGAAGPIKNPKPRASTPEVIPLD